ncbi:MAG: polyprenyl synthetase family protein [Bacteroidota bacterium]|nr:polyprenyl synthetase family protein [Candidatus Kapabacteria bacterium]MDW8220959.1 polyprenyl synthetase family protein [Bacteroidota bacterium]
MTLGDIVKPIQPYIQDFDTILKEQMRSNVLLLDTVVRYILRQRGKRIRPLLVLLSAAICGNVNRRTHIGATMVELLHTASLIHDDVVDESAQRRGMASINAIWKNKIAVLVGDYLLSRGLLIAVENGEYDFLRITSHAVRRMSEGELLQIQKTRQLDMDEATYFRIISDKTASLISTCCEIGAVSASSNPDHHKALREYGEIIGSVFQIRDDTFDYSGGNSLIGKPTGNDVQEKKLTLPLVYAFSQASAKESKEILKVIKSKPTKKDVKLIIDFVKRYKGIEYAEQKAYTMIAEAKHKLNIFDNSPAKTSLLLFADYSFQRLM